MNIEKPKNFNNTLYLLECERRDVQYIAKQLDILKNFWKPHGISKGIVAQKAISYEIDYLEYLLFWHNQK